MTEWRAAERFTGEPRPRLARCPAHDGRGPSLSIRDLGHAKRMGRPFPAADILRAIAFEALVVAVAGSSLLEGKAFSIIDRERLTLAVSRIQAALDAGGLNHG
ncbi:MAG: hypothetical protein KGK17_09035 [Betaproteobacteria bacterium]|nr:hypothetical protein [Betaproteobacteria bacterium]